MKMTRSGNGFGPEGQKCLKTASGGSKNQVQTEKWLARNENEPFWQWSGKPIQFQVLLDPDGCKNQIFGPDRKRARTQWKWAVLAMVWEAYPDFQEK